MFNHNGQHGNNDQKAMSSSVAAAAHSFDDALNHNQNGGPGPAVISPTGGHDQPSAVPLNNGGSAAAPAAPQHDEPASAPPLSLPSVHDNKAPLPDTPSSHPHGSAPSDDLLDIKQDALQHLSPLVGQLNQPPEEKFRTLMMLIQAADDQSLVKEAYATAQQIPDDKLRAQALLDIVNEINYFTQHQQ